MAELYALIFGISILFKMVASLIALALYIFKSIVLMKYANNQGEANSWMAWIPIVDMYLYTNSTYKNASAVRDEIINVDLPTPVFQWQTVIFWVVPGILSGIPVINGISGILMLVARVIIFGQLYKDSMRQYGMEVNIVEQILASIITPVAYIRLLASMGSNTPTVY